MQLLKVYLWMVQISLASFGGAYSIWALLISGADRDCHSVIPKSAHDSVNPVGACRDNLQRLMAMGELLPGPQVNAISMTTHADYGIAGMVVVILGLITPGLVIVPTLLWLLRQHFSLVLVKAFFTGAGIATTAILAHFALSLIRPLVATPGPRSILVGSCTAVALVLSMRYKVNPGLIVVLGGIFGYFFL